MAARPIQPEHYNYETGARKYPASEKKQAETDKHAGMPTANPFGLTQPEDETNEKTRQSEGVMAKRDEPASADHNKAQPTTDHNKTALAAAWCAVSARADGRKDDYDFWYRVFELTRH
ncbi:hypothetical protein NKI25_16390 [Mesorhizobium sp. M0808]|uniref:hypothetical protein n=1 Tax=Mesorhizobium sp. M0808 TaxID=2957002 RepID=UPI00333659AB